MKKPQLSTLERLAISLIATREKIEAENKKSDPSRDRQSRLNAKFDRLWKDLEKELERREKKRESK